MNAAFCLALAGVLATTAAAHAGAAADPAACRVVRMADPGWADVAATNALAGAALEALGYEQKILPLSVPITYAGMDKGQVDVFLGNWMPAQRALVEPLLKSGAVEQLHANLPQAKFTLAVPDYVAQAGVHTFADLAKYADRFDRRIYGIESGSPANQTIRKMLAAHAYGMERWVLVESSEQGMLSQVARNGRTGAWIVFLAWEPHQMNNRFKITYLDGGDAWFGPRYGAASVHTTARRGYRAACPNAARLFAQLTFSAPLEHAMIAALQDKKTSPRDAARRQLRAHPELLDAWLAGVTMFTGGAAPASASAPDHQ
jgi:glycine betaine/proline transport system substrate-binding protein